MDHVANLILGMAPSVIVGMAAAYLTAHRFMAQTQVKIETLERTVAKIVESERNDAERLVRLETKMDILIGLRIPPGASPEQQ